MKLKTKSCLKIPISLDLGSNGHLAKKYAGKGASVGPFSVKEAVWRIKLETSKVGHL